LSQFQSVTVDDIVAAVRALPRKSWALDPLPTTGAFKATYIIPLVKKSGTNTDDVQSYRPISNLSVASKLFKRTAAKQLIAYLEKSAFLPQLQSAYRTGHSSKTAVLKVLSDIITLVPSSVNGDIEIQWEWSNFDPSQNPNPLTDYDKTLHN